MASGIEPWNLIVILLAILLLIFVVVILVAVAMFAVQTAAKAKPRHLQVRRH
jgi:hypothetical protein